MTNREYMNSLIDIVGKKWEMAFIEKSIPISEWEKAREESNSFIALLSEVAAKGIPDWAKTWPNSIPYHCEYTKNKYKFLEMER